MALFGLQTGHQLVPYKPGHIIPDEFRQG